MCLSAAATMEFVIQSGGWMTEFSLETSHDVTTAPQSVRTTAHYTSIHDKNVHYKILSLTCSREDDYENSQIKKNQYLHFIKYIGTDQYWHLQN